MRLFLAGTNKNSSKSIKLEKDINNQMSKYESFECVSQNSEIWDYNDVDKYQKAKDISDYTLFLITPSTVNSFTIALMTIELVKNPDKVLYCFEMLDYDKYGHLVPITNEEKESIKHLQYFIKDNGGKIILSTRLIPREIEILHNSK